METALRTGGKVTQLHGMTLVMDLQGMGKRHLAPRGLSLIAGLFATAQKVYVENISRTPCVPYSLAPLHALPRNIDACGCV